MSSYRIRVEDPGRSDLAMTRSSSADDHRAQSTAIIVLVLSLACTALALFDLLLLAGGL